MKRLLLPALLAAAGCGKSAPTAPTASQPAPPPAATPGTPTPPAPPARKSIEVGKPEFDAMLADFKADPKTKKYERAVVTFVMTVGAVKQVNKEAYRVTGTGPGVNLVCDFLRPPNLPDLNRQVTSLAPGDKLTYWAEPTEYKPGTPPKITSLSGSIMGVEPAAK